MKQDINDPFANRIKFWQKKQFCEELKINSTITNLCDLIIKYENDKMKKLNMTQCYAIYLLNRYYSKKNISQIILSCFDEEKELIDDIKLDKSKQTIDCKYIIDRIWIDPSLTLKSILNKSFNKLNDNDEIKLKLTQNIFSKMRNNEINANIINQQLCLFKSDLKISNKIDLHRFVLSDLF